MNPNSFHNISDKLKSYKRKVTRCFCILVNSHGSKMRIKYQVVVLTKIWILGYTIESSGLLDKVYQPSSCSHMHTHRRKQLELGQRMQTTNNLLVHLQLDTYLGSLNGKIITNTHLSEVMGHPSLWIHLLA